jgi:phospholipid transport system substrate-binding protein
VVSRHSGERPSTVLATAHDHRSVVAALLAFPVVAALLWSVTAGTAVGATDTPRGVVEELANAAVSILGDKSLSTDVKKHKIEDVVYTHVDFDTLARLILARNWQQFSDQQKQEFIQEFKKHLSMTYGKSVDNYKNEKAFITADREEARGDWTVQTKIVRGGPDDIQVDYRLRKNGAGEWKIIDVIIEGVSLVSTFRSQIQEAVSQGGPENAIKLLHEKNVKGEPLKGVPRPK